MRASLKLKFAGRSAHLLQKRRRIARRKEGNLA
jgi:hypothetical protein